LRSSKQEHRDTQRHVKRVRNRRIAFAIDAVAVALIVIGMVFNLVQVIDVGLALVAFVGIIGWLSV